MLPYIISLDVLSFYFGSIHGLLKGHQNKGLVCVALYCMCRLMYKLFKARRNKQKRMLRKDVAKLKYETLQQNLDNFKNLPSKSVDNLRYPVDISLTELSFQEICVKAQKQEGNIYAILLAFQIRAVSADLYTNAVVEFIDIEDENAVVGASSSLTANSQENVPQLLKNIPVSLAEVIHVKNLESTAGLSSYLQLKASEDAVVLQLLRLQGAIPVIRSNIPQTAYITFGSSNPIFGVTRNPIKGDRSPGGTSSGEAVIVATRGSVLGVGTDIAGGLRIPAHFCGICGFKPTSERVSQKGVTLPVEGQDAVATCVGPLSFEVDGLVAFMRSVCVPLQHKLDPTVPMIIFDDKLYNSTEPLRIGFFVDDGHTKCVPSVRRAIMEATELLRNAGYTVVPFEPPDLLRMLTNMYLPIVLGDHFTTFIRYLTIDSLDSCVKRVYYLTQLPYAIRWLWSWCFSRKNHVNASLMAVNLPQSVSYWWKHVKETTAWRHKFITRMIKENIDVLLCPVLPFAAVKLGKEESLTGCLTYCVLFNLLDFPAGTIPISVVTKEDVANLNIPEKYKVETSLEERIRLDQMGSKDVPSSSSEDMPVGVQVASLPFQDEMVLRVLRDLEIQRNKGI